jgi:hypothetical protein
LNESETLTFVWSAPSELRVFVRGQPCTASSGAPALTDEALPRVLHAGLALGPDPAVPEAKRTTGLQIARVFHQASSNSSGSNGGAKRAGSKVSAPVARTVTEPATGLAMPTEVTLNTGSSKGGGGSDAGKENTPSSPSSGGTVRLQLLGCGVKVKKLGFIDVQVYAVGVFAEPQGCKTAITPWHQKHLANKNGGGGTELENELFDALLAGAPPDSSSSSSAPPSSIAFYPRALHLVFARSVSGKQVSDALAERLKLVVSAAAFNAFSNTLLTGIGSDTPLAKGETLSYLWSAPAVVRVFVRGACVGEVNDEKLPRTLFVGFLGPQESQSPAAKAAVPAGAAALFRG